MVDYRFWLGMSTWDRYTCVLLAHDVDPNLNKQDAHAAILSTNTYVAFADHTLSAYAFERHIVTNPLVAKTNELYKSRFENDEIHPARALIFYEEIVHKISPAFKAAAVSLKVYPDFHYWYVDLRRVDVTDYQSKILEQLWLRRIRNLAPISASELIAAADLKTSENKISKLFQRCPEWKKLIITSGPRNCYYSLSPDALTECEYRLSTKGDIKINILQ